VELEWTPEQIFNDVFSIDSERISLSYLKKLCGQLRDADFAYIYLGDAGEQSVLCNLAKEHPQWNQKKLKESFKQLYYANAAAHDMSSSTVSRVLRRGDVSRKTIELRHMRRNDLAGFDYMQRMAMVDPVHLVDIDETASSLAAFLQKYGYAQVGDRAVTTQFVIGSRMFLDYRVGDSDGAIVLGDI
jgi:hypothetical protein